MSIDPTEERAEDYASASSVRPEKVMQRITTLTGAPVIGQFYLVPTVRYPWRGRTADWPVFPHLHRDAKFIKFDIDHYHVDPRFLNKRDWRCAGDDDDEAFKTSQVSPLSSRGAGVHPPIIWRRRTCQRAAIPYQIGYAPWISDMRDHFGGQQCERARTGWVCPHWNIPLGSFPAIDGVITCPLHGLRIDAETGRVVPSAGPKGQDKSPPHLRDEP